MDNTKTIQLRELAYARSGDKGDVCNIGLLAFTKENYELIRRHVTSERVKKHFGDMDAPPGTFLKPQF